MLEIRCNKAADLGLLRGRLPLLCTEITCNDFAIVYSNYRS